MKITVVGASGLIGTRVVELLRREGHEVVAASRRSGVDTVTGDGVADALGERRGARGRHEFVRMGARCGLAFFTTSTSNLVEAVRSAGVGHLRGVVDRRRRWPRRRLLPRQGGAGAPRRRVRTLPYSIVRATQFAEFTAGIIGSMTTDDEIRVPDALIQPIAADDVAAAVARAAVAEPIHGILNVGGPARITFEQLAREVLAQNGDGSEADRRRSGRALLRGATLEGEPRPTRHSLTRIPDRRTTRGTRCVTQESP